MIDLIAMGPALLRLLRHSVRIFLLTLLFAIVGAVVLGAICAWFLRDESGFYRFLSWFLIVAECLVVGVYLARRRAIANTLAEGLTSLRLGSTLLGLVFDRVPAKATVAEPSVGTGLQTVQSGEAEQVISESVADLSQEASLSSWLPQKLQTRLLDLIQRYTSIRIHETAEGKRELNLHDLRGDLSQSIDQRLADQVRAASRFWTTLAFIGLPLLAALQTFLLLQIAQLSATR